MLINILLLCWFLIGSFINLFYSTRFKRTAVWRKNIWLGCCVFSAGHPSHHRDRGGEPRGHHLHRLRHQGKINLHPVPSFRAVFLKLGDLLQQLLARNKKPYFYLGDFAPCYVVHHKISSTLSSETIKKCN